MTIYILCNMLGLKKEETYTAMLKYGLFLLLIHSSVHEIRYGSFSLKSRLSLAVFRILFKLNHFYVHNLSLIRCSVYVF